MPETFHLQVISPDRLEFEGDVESLVAPAVDGDLGVLAHHAPLLACLGSGRLRVRPAYGSEMVYDVEGGFLEVSDNRAVVLAQSLSPV